MLKRRIVISIALAIIMVAAFAVCGTAQSKDEAKTDIPEAILKAFQGQYPDAKITGFEKEADDSTTVFEIECTDGDTEKNVVLSAEGKIIQVEQEIAVTSLPESCTKAVMSAFKGAKIEEAEMISRDSVVEYEVVLVVGEKEIEALISADGTIVESGEIADVDEDANADEDADVEDDDEDEVKGDDD
jgi:hypothetical protein